ncbi:unnamed protein product [Musa acuminata subsp. malaccensis]|uniref:(wild Malaysian banana) hypothetical protein n=1 Tax=Musa acuminata subsp. malaccensis TaxID=214687 RepID=A0A804HUH5_MUSAM|nr:unnamed protein product [Musa acuminata subsp. malaccensis]
METKGDDAKRVSHLLWVGKAPEIRVTGLRVMLKVPELRVVTRLQMTEKVSYKHDSVYLQLVTWLVKMAKEIFLLRNHRVCRR